MKPYKNIAGNSGVVSYEIGTDFIDVQFRNRAKVYRYSYGSAGKADVEKAKLLAKNGKGLSGYISQHMKNAYEK